MPNNSHRLYSAEINNRNLIAIIPEQALDTCVVLDNTITCVHPTLVNTRLGSAPAKFYFRTYQPPLLLPTYLPQRNLYNDNGAIVRTLSPSWGTCLLLPLSPPRLPIQDHRILLPHHTDETATLLSTTPTPTTTISTSTSPKKLPL